MILVNTVIYLFIFAMFVPPFFQNSRVSCPYQWLCPYPCSCQCYIALDFSRTACNILPMQPIVAFHISSLLCSKFHLASSNIMSLKNPRFSHSKHRHLVRGFLSLSSFPLANILECVWCHDIGLFQTSSILWSYQLLGVQGSLFIFRLAGFSGSLAPSIVTCVHGSFLVTFQQGNNHLIAIAPTKWLTKNYSCYSRMQISCAISSLRSMSLLYFVDKVSFLLSLGSLCPSTQYSSYLKF